MTTDHEPMENTMTSRIKQPTPAELEAEALELADRAADARRLANQRTRAVTRARDDAAAAYVRQLVDSGRAAADSERLERSWADMVRSIAGGGDVATAWVEFSVVRGESLAAVRWIASSADALGVRGARPSEHLQKRWSAATINDAFEAAGRMVSAQADERTTGQLDEALAEAEEKAMGTAVVPAAPVATFYRAGGWDASAGTLPDLDDGEIVIDHDLAHAWTHRAARALRAVSNAAIPSWPREISPDEVETVIAARISDTEENAA